MSHITKSLIADFKRAGIEVDDPFGPWPGRIAAIVILVGGGVAFVIAKIFGG